MLFIDTFIVPLTERFFIAFMYVYNVCSQYLTNIIFHLILNAFLLSSIPNTKKPTDTA